MSSLDGASKAPLQIAAITPTTGAATVTAPATLSFWGRGVAGDWELEVTPFEVSSKGVDLQKAERNSGLDRLSGICAKRLTRRFEEAVSDSVAIP